MKLSKCLGPSCTLEFFNDQTVIGKITFSPETESGKYFHSINATNTITGVTTEFKEETTAIHQEIFVHCLNDETNLQVLIYYKIMLNILFIFDVKY